MSPVALRIPGSSVPGRHFPANRPSSAVDLTELTNTPPTRTIGLHDDKDHESAGEASMAIDNGHEHGNGRCQAEHPGAGLREEVYEHDMGEEVHVEEAYEGESDMSVLLRTVNFAAQKHSCQRRKDLDQTPYINHPIAVANFLSTTGIADVRVLQAAVLHDTVEDTHTSIDEIARVFGRDVARIVDECTDDPALSGQQRKTAQVRAAPHKSREAQQVKLADKLHNLESIRRSPPVGWGVRRVQAYFVWAKQVTDICAPSHPLLADRLQKLYETAYTKINGSYHPCHPEVCGPLTEAEKARIDSRFMRLKAGEKPSPKPIFF